MEEYYQEKFTSAHKESLAKGVYEECLFKQLDLSNADLAEYKFIDCKFEECNLSNSKLRDTSFQDCEFKRSKLMGMQFEDCKAFNFGIHFKDSQLDHATFYQMDLNSSSFVGCELKEVDFAEANLSSTKLTSCNLLNANFDRTILENTDFRGSLGIQLDPEQNQLKGAKFNSDQLIGLLSKYQIELED